MDLVMVLINATRPVTRADLRRRIPGYNQDSEAAFTRMFERDKDDLRELGIPIEVKPVEAAYDDELGYWVDRKTFLLPAIELTMQERVLITLAARLLRDTQMGLAAREAAQRLGNVTHPEKLPDIRLGSSEANIDVAFDAIHARTVLAFDYDSKSSQQRALRHVEPWRLICTGGAWYVAGFDTDRRDVRVFRFDRVLGPMVDTHQPAGETPPANLDVQAMVRAWQTLPGERVNAVLHVDPGTCLALRAIATSVEDGDDHDVITVESDYPLGLARTIAGVGEHVTIVSPTTLRDQVMTLVTEAARG